MMTYFRNTVILIGILTLVFEITGRKVDAQKCRKPHGLFPKPGSFCKSYYRCTNWIPVEEECPFGQHFDAIHGWCEYAEIFPCFEKPPSKECPRSNGNFLKPGTGCKVYYQCCNGKPTEKFCPEDQLFDPDAEKCEWPNLYTCVEKPPSKKCPRPNGKFLKPGTGCKIYYQCHRGQSKEKLCPEDQLFDPNAEKCEWPDLYTCVENILSKDVTTNPTPSTASSTKSSTSTVKDYDTPTTAPVTTTDTTTEDSFSTTSHDDNTEKNTKTSTRFVDIYSSTDYTETSTTEMIISTSTDAMSTTQTNEYPENTPSPTLTEIPSTNEGSDEITKSTSRMWDIISSTVLNILCPEPNGYFPHPTDKHKFVGCVDDHPSVLECPEDLIYKHRIRACDYE